MKILAIADRPPTRNVLETIEKEQIELVITLGDLTQHDVIDLAKVTNIPKIGVYGNHDSGMYFDPLGIWNMHLMTWEYKGLTFGGFQGSNKYKEADAPMFTQEEASRLMKDFPNVDVFIAHSPPYGINDDPTEIAHTGFHAFREYLEKMQPRYFLHGHTYPSKEEEVHQYQNTKIVYVFADQILDIS